jgi:unsaturated rhamnogalacturonyl hydrolase
LAWPRGPAAVWTGQGQDQDKSQTHAAHWGTGNGWVAAGLARALRLHRAAPQDVPPEHPATLANQARALIDACLTWQRPDGLFHDVLDDQNTFVETNTAQMIAYAIFTGVADLWLPPSYARRAADLLAAATANVDSAGFVRGVCGSPDFVSAGISPEGQAFHLLAKAASRRIR